MQSGAARDRGERLEKWPQIQNMEEEKRREEEKEQEEDKGKSRRIQKKR